MKQLIATMIIVFIMMIPVKSHEGPLILVGGGTIPPKVIDLFKQKSKHGKFVVVTCHTDSDNRWIKLLNDPILILPESVTNITCDISGLIIDGGDQWNYISRLDGRFIDKVHKSGIPILGTSAGSMILGEYFFSAEKGTITSQDAIENRNVCLGKQFAHIDLLKGSIIDTHLNARNRLDRLKVFVRQSGARYGIGIDEATALYLDNEHTYVIGTGQVTLVENK